MDEMSLASIPLCEKSKAPAAKTTMSVREMQHLLGLGKTESYWLIHKNFFEVIQINDKMRVVISSFENGTPIRSSTTRSMALLRERNFANVLIPLWKQLRF